MATTYDKNILSAEDYTKLEDAQNEWKAAKKAGDKAGMTAAHNRAEAIRSAYGYSGGADGGGYTAIPGYEGAEKIQKATEQVKEAASGYDAAYDAVGDVYKAQAEASKADIAKQRESAMKEAYIGNMMDQKNLDQKLRAGGITGGLSETSKVAIQNNYRTNRNAVETAAIEAGKDVDLELSKNLAQNELSRADTKYNTTVNEANFQTNAANFQNTAANNNRNIVATEKQLKSEEENANLSKYLTFLDNGYVDDNNIGKISQAIGVSEDTIRKANAQRQNGQYENMALTLMSNGIYDDSFVNYFGGRFSAETLKAFTQQNIPKTPTSSRGSNNGNDDVVYDAIDDDNNLDPNNKFAKEEQLISEMPGIAEKNPNSPISEYSYDQLKEFMLGINFGTGYTENDWAEVGNVFGISATEAKNFVNAFKRTMGIK